MRKGLVVDDEAIIEFLCLCLGQAYKGQQFHYNHDQDNDEDYDLYDLCNEWIGGKPLGHIPNDEADSDNDDDGRRN